MDALAVPETYFWREIDQIAAIVAHVVPQLVRRGRPRRCASGACRAHRRGAADDRDAARRGGLVRPRARSRSTPATPARRRSRGRGPAATASARSARCRRPCARSISGADGDAWTVDPGAPAPDHLVERRQPAATTRRSSVRRAVPIVFCRNVFIYFSDGGHPARRRSVRARDAGARRTVRRRVRIAAAGDRRGSSSRTRRRVRLRQAVIVERN